MPAKLPTDKALEDMQRLAQEHGGELVPGQQYRGSQGKLQFRCITHDLTFEQMPQNLRVGKWGCSECAREARRAGTQRSLGITDPTQALERLQQVVRQHNGEIAPGEVYINAHTKVAVTCLIHGTTFAQTPDRLARGLWGCPQCRRDPVAALAKVEEAARQHGGALVPGQEWRGSKTKLWFRCGQHGTEFEQESRNVLSHWGCPDCRSETGVLAAGRRSRKTEKDTTEGEIE